MRRAVSDDEISPYAKKLWWELNPSKSGKMKGRGKQGKLITDLHDKDNYIVHYRNLKLYLELGLELKQIHKVLEFDQDRWLKCYIDFNTERRKEAKSEFEKNFFKILNFSVFSKVMKNQRRYKVVHLANNERKLNKILSKPTFETCKIFNENLVAAQCKNAKVVITKPVYVGQAVLDLSNVLTFSFWYKGPGSFRP